MLHISFGKNSRDTKPRGREMTFEQFVELVRKLPPHTGQLTWTEYCVAGKLERGRDKDSAWFIPALFVRPERKADAVGSLSGFVCDFDDGVVDRACIEAFARTNGCRLVAWTSYSNGLDGKAKLRAFVPYREPISPDQHQRVFRYFNLAFQGHLDPRCATVSQLWYLPGRPKGAPPSDFFVIFEGTDFDVSRMHEDERNQDRDGAPGELPVGALSTLAARAVRDNDDLVTRGPSSLLDIRSALEALDPNLYAGYTEWLNIGMAIYDGTQGSAEGYDIFDRWSASVPGYDGPDSTLEKWQSFGGRSGKSRITVASLFKLAKECGWVGGFSSVTLQSPVLRDADRNPVAQPISGVLGSHQSRPTSVLPVPVAPPARWRAHPTNYATQKQVEDPDTGNTRWVTCINNFKITNLDLLKTIDGGDHTIEMIAQNADGEISGSYKAGLLASPTEFKAHLMERGMFVTANEFKDLQEMILDWLKKIQENIRVKQSFTHLGWMQKDTAHLGFAHGVTAFYADGTQETNIKVAIQGGSSICKHYIPQGDMKTWKQVADYLSKQNRPELMAIVATSFGSPLMKFSGHSGAVVSIVSTASGVGKSTSLALAQSVWANPKTAMHSATDTVLSLSSKMGFTKDLPAYWDDIKGEKTFEQFASTIYQITQGQEKARLTQQAELREVQNWNCLAVIAANDSLIEIVRRYTKGTDSGIARIFEIRLEARPEQAMQSTFFDRTSSHYGLAGAVYAEWLARNPDKAKALVEQAVVALSNELEAGPEERFWVAACAVMIAGAKIAKHLNLVEFDIGTLSAFLKKRFLELRGGKTQQMKELDAGPMVADLILDHQISTLRIEKMPYKNIRTQVTRPPKNGDVDIMIADQDGILRVRKSKFVEWCRKRGHSHTTLFEKLTQLGAVKERSGDPMANTLPYSSNSRTVCYDIDLKILGLQGGPDD